MKKIVFTLIVMSLILSSCDKDSLGVSKIVTYPTIGLNGDVALTIPVGGSYQEKGCVVKEGDLDLSSKAVVSGSVNPSVAGVYTITYTYKAAGKIYPEDSLELKIRRFVGVIDPVASAMNISGQYKRNAGALGVATVVKTAYPGLYINDNPGGIAMTGTNQLYIYMFQPTPGVVVAPPQTTTAGEFSCVNGVYDTSGAKPLYKWVCINSGYGAALRTFIKQ